MKNFHIWILVIITTFAQAQTSAPAKRTCATLVPDEEWNKLFNEKVEEFKNTNLAGKNQNANYTIPVIFHVIHGGEAVGTFPNLSPAQINSQITILNNDFGGTGFNAANFANTTFNQSLKANCNITFCLAEKNPSGATLTEKGINRIDYVAKGWSNPTSHSTSTAFRNYIENTVKANSIWNPSQYLNIWISDVNPNVGLLGYATFPPVAGLTGLTSGIGTLSDDGVWCWSKAIGDVGTLVPAYNKGRTATHEVGHYLGLRHIWGDANCGNDYCNDTPTQKEENTACPTFPSSTCSNGVNGDMFMNFMDYSHDYCLYMFTNDQRSRMQTAMANSSLRKNLTASSATLCGVTFAPCSYTVTNFSSVDTLFSYRRITAAASDVQCPQGNLKAGYLSGTNCYDDKEKAEFFNASKYSQVSNPKVTGVIVLFFQYGNMGTDGSGNVTLNIYSGSGVTSQPGTLLGSATENLATIAATTNTTSVPYCGNPSLAFNLPVIMPYKFNFTSPVSVPQSGGFFASVVLPTAAGDTAVIMDESTAEANTSWEKWSDNTWHDMKSVYGGRSFKLAILPIMECAPVGIAKNSLLQNSIDLFPNPNTGNFSIMTSLPYAQELSVTVYNLPGEKVYSQTMEQVKQNVIEINMAEYPAGIYFVEVNNGTEKVIKRLVISR